ncbi:hypothetical protein LOK49_LG07G02988 [Camellia lanceoleosa]|uniref:Uncharacterized protein n=1 Tax=Camellia lanceoleosa TaxID=1840588 RepID=A0ACC0H0P9_9ERIC|nr:hypothetical protein LOK49_LG07G02988 [Camellia lanceoleosa]
MNLLSFLIIISSIFSISMASCNPDHDADELATQLNHDEWGAEWGEFSDTSSSSSAIVDHDLSASTSFSGCEQVRGDQPPITTVAATQDQFLESGTSDNEDGGELLKRGQASQQDSTGRMETRTRALDLGWTFLGLAFLALLCLAIFHFQAPSTSTSTSTSTSSSSSMWYYLIGVAMLMIGIPLRNAYPTAASIGEHIGMFSIAFGFLVMTRMFLPDGLNCSVFRGASELLILGFVFAFANMMQR